MSGKRKKNLRLGPSVMLFARKQICCPDSHPIHHLLTFLLPRATPIYSGTCSPFLILSTEIYCRFAAYHPGIGYYSTKSPDIPFIMQ